MTPTYTAAANPDGTFNVYDVPVFAEVPAGSRRGVKETIGTEWMLAAVERDKMRRGEGYRAPVHIGHHEPGVTPTRAGSFRLVRVGKTTYEGREVDCVFADFENLTPEAFAAIQRGELPYRSVEILNAADTEINSIALLSSEVPHFRFPNLAVSLLWTDADAAKLSADAPVPVLFRFNPQETAMDPDKKNAPKEDGMEEKQPPVAAAAAESKLSPDVEDGEDTGSSAQKDAAASEASEVVIEAGLSEKEAHEMIKATFEGVKRILALLAPNDGTMQNPPGALEPNDVNEAPVSASAATVADGGTLEVGRVNLVASAAPAAALDLAALKGEIVALKAREEKREKDAETARLVASAKAELAGFNFDASTATDLEAFAALGADHLKRYVEGIKRVAVEDGPRNLAELEATASQRDPEEVAAFRSHGPDALKLAREVAREHAALVQGGAGAALPPLSRFLASHTKTSSFAGQTRRSN